MNISRLPAIILLSVMPFGQASAQADFETLLCEAAETGRVVVIVYNEDASKGCLPRLFDVH